MKSDFTKALDQHIQDKTEDRIKEHSELLSEIDKYMEVKYPVTFERTRHYFVELRDLAGCCDSGVSKESALAQLAITKRNWIKNALEDGIDIPEPSYSEGSDVTI